MEAVTAPTRATLAAVAVAAASAARTWEKSGAAAAAVAKEATIEIGIARGTAPTGIAGEAAAGGCETTSPPTERLCRFAKPGSRLAQGPSLRLAAAAAAEVGGAIVGAGIAEGRGVGWEMSSCRVGRSPRGAADAVGAAGVDAARTCRPR